MRYVLLWQHKWLVTKPSLSMHLTELVALFAAIRLVTVIRSCNICTVSHVCCDAMLASLHLLAEGVWMMLPQLAWCSKLMRLSTSTHSAVLTVVAALLQKIYLFRAEGTTPDRGRPRPASATASSPAKRARTHNELEAHPDNEEGNETEDEEHQEPGTATDSDSHKLDRDQASTSEHCLSCNVLFCLPRV